MVAAAKAAMPTVGDQAAALQLGNFAKATASALAELKAASTKVKGLSLSLSLSLLYFFSQYMCTYIIQCFCPAPPPALGC